MQLLLWNHKYWLLMIVDSKLFSLYRLLTRLRIFVRHSRKKSRKNYLQTSNGVNCMRRAFISVVWIDELKSMCFHLWANWPVNHKIKFRLIREALDLCELVMTGDDQRFNDEKKTIEFQSIDKTRQVKISITFCCVSRNSTDEREVKTKQDDRSNCRVCLILIRLKSCSIDNSSNNNKDNVPSFVKQIQYLSTLSLWHTNAIYDELLLMR